MPVFETDRFRVRKPDGTYDYQHVTCIYVDPGGDLQAEAARFLRCPKETCERYSASFATRETCS